MHEMQYGRKHRDIWKGEKWSFKDLYVITKDLENSDPQNIMVVLMTVSLVYSDLSSQKIKQFSE